MCPIIKIKQRKKMEKAGELTCTKEVNIYIYIIVEGN